MTQNQDKQTSKKPNPADRFKGPGPGRAKGSTNRFTNLKKAFLDTFEKIEVESGKKESAIKSLYEWATKNDKNQAIFYQMCSKMLPANLNIDGEVSITYLVSEEFFNLPMMPIEAINIPHNGGQKALNAHEDK